MTIFAFSPSNNKFTLIISAITLLNLHMINLSKRKERSDNLVIAMLIHLLLIHL